MDLISARKNKVYHKIFLKTVWSPEKQMNTLSQFIQCGRVFLRPLISWDDLDAQGTWLRVRYEQIDDGDGFDLHDARFPRSVPLPAHVHSDLMKWRRIQQKAIAAMPPFFWGCTSVTLLLNGYQMDAEILKSIFQDILHRSNLSNMPFSALRDTFAARSLEQGISEANLCGILGEPMAADIYSRFKDSQGKTNKATDNLYKVEMLRRKNGGRIRKSSILP